MAQPERDKEKSARALEQEGCGLREVSARRRGRGFVIPVLGAVLSLVGVWLLVGSNEIELSRIQALPALGAVLAALVGNTLLCGLRWRLFHRDQPGALRAVGEYAQSAAIALMVPLGGDAWRTRCGGAASVLADRAVSGVVLLVGVAITATSVLGAYLVGALGSVGGALVAAAGVVGVVALVAVERHLRAGGELPGVLGKLGAVRVELANPALRTPRVLISAMGLSVLQLVAAAVCVGAVFSAVGVAYSPTAVALATPLILMAGALPGFAGVGPGLGGLVGFALAQGASPGAALSAGALIVVIQVLAVIPGALLLLAEAVGIRHSRAQLDVSGKVRP